MPLPPDVQEAKERMEKAQAALIADIADTETGAAARARRDKLIDELRVATDNFVAKIQGR